MARLWYWIRKTVLHAKECRGCCIMCEYYEVCRNDGTLEYEVPVKTKQMFDIQGMIIGQIR